VLDVQKIRDAVDAFLSTSAEGRVLTASVEGMSIVTSSAREWGADRTFGAAADGCSGGRSQAVTRPAGDIAGDSIRLKVA
jgi:hypothetical protein